MRTILGLVPLAILLGAFGDDAAPTRRPARPTAPT
jgi:hypothetical protein